MTTNKPEVFEVYRTRQGTLENVVLLADYEALQAECEKLRQQVETFQGLKPAMPPTGEGLPRYGLRWNGPSQPLSVPMVDGYWSPWHLAQGECEKLRTILAQAREYVFEPDRDCKCQECVDATSLLCAIDAAMQVEKP